MRMKTSPIALILLAAALATRPGYAATADCMNKQRSEDFKNVQRLYSEQKYEQAADILLKLTEACPCVGRLELWLGKSFYKARKPGPAVSGLKSFLDCDPQIEESTKTEVLMMIGEMEELAKAERDKDATPKTATGSGPNPAPEPPPSSEPHPESADGSSPELNSRQATASTAPVELKPEPLQISTGNIAPTAPLGGLEPSPPEPSQGQPPPFYKRWWFWTAVGSAVVAGTTTAFLVARGSGGSRCDGIGPNCLEFK
jgi:hypothetical protein